MANDYKILAQLDAAATTEEVLYTVPALTQTVISTITVCNLGVAGSFRLGVSLGGGALGAADYLYHDLAIDEDDTFALTFGLTLDAADEIRVYASHTNISFNVFGTEIT